MKIHLTAFTILFVCLQQTHTAAALSSFACYIPPTCGGSADSTCDNICAASSCPSGTPSMPAGYTGKIAGRTVQTKCNSNGTYSCYCGMNSLSNLSCASGYTGTAKYEYINGTDYFSGCFKNSSPSDPILVCPKGSYKAGTACEPCPADNSVNGTTAGSGTTDISKCYIAAGTSVSDTSGTYTYTNDCYYTKIIIGDLDPIPIN